jgi:hypothetical protein
VAAGPHRLWKIRWTKEDRTSGGVCRISQVPYRHVRVGREVGDERSQSDMNLALYPFPTRHIYILLNKVNYR